MSPGNPERRSERLRLFDYSHIASARLRIFLPSCFVAICVRRLRSFYFLIKYSARVARRNNIDRARGLTKIENEGWRGNTVITYLLPLLHIIT